MILLHTYCVRICDHVSLALVSVPQHPVYECPADDAAAGCVSAPCTADEPASQSDTGETTMHTSKYVLTCLYLSTRLDSEEKFNANIFKRLGELGLLGVTVPPEYGGSGMDASAACIVHEELSAADPACCLSYLGKCIARKTIHGSGY